IANAELAEHSTGRAERRLRDAIDLARREHMDYQALLLEKDLFVVHRDARALTLAAGEAAAVLRGAIAAGEWTIEKNVISWLGTLNEDRYATGLARAYLTEQIERANHDLDTAPAPSTEHDCIALHDAYWKLANISVGRLEVARARAEAALAPRCGEH